MDPTDAARSGGYEIRLDDPTAPLNAVGEWNTYEISIADDRAEAYVNGVRTLRVDGGVPAGRIWLGSAGDGCFRDIRVRREV